MEGGFVYRLSHSTGTVELFLSSDRWVVKTHGTGLADKLRVIDVPLAALRQFAVTPTSAAQNRSGTRGMVVVDTARNAELIFSFVVGGSSKTRRVFVAADDPAFRALIDALARLRPDASLLALPPADAFKRLGVLSPQQGVMVVLAIVVGIPVAGIAIWALVRAFS